MQNQRLGEHDLTREIVHSHWDGVSQPIYVYRDELALPSWQRTHIVDVRAR